MDLRCGVDWTLKAACDDTGHLIIRLVGPDRTVEQTVDSLVVSAVMREVADALPSLALPSRMNFATLGWASMWALAQSRASGRLAVEALEQISPLDLTEAQTFLREISRQCLNSMVPVRDSGRFGCALCTCVLTYGNGASDLHEVAQPLRFADRTAKVLDPEALTA